jgi:hypothetical protein
MDDCNLFRRFALMRADLSFGPEDTGTADDPAAD